MQLSTTDGKAFTLRRETETDQQLLDQLENARAAYVIDCAHGDTLVVETAIVGEGGAA